MKRLEAILEEHAFINMLASGLECYACETYGSIYGKKIADEFYVIQNAFPSATAKRKTNKVTWPIRFSNLSIKIKSPDSEYLGDFHSHPNNTPEYSNPDKKGMKYDRSLLYIIYSINPMKRGYQPRRWRTKNMLLTGTFDFDKTRYLFMFALYFFNHHQGRPKLARLICPYAEQL